MNFNKFINSDYLKSNPLCGISTYKDELNLATGACTRRIKKLVLTGEEDGWVKNSTITSGNAFYNASLFTGYKPSTGGVCTHYKTVTSISATEGAYWGANINIITSFADGIDTALKWNQYLAQQYAANTPVTIWYVLATPTTETITVPSGLSGTEEGYLIQDGTPSPTNPIYPTANTVQKWFDIPHYIMGTSTDTLTTLPAVLYPNDTTATVGLKGDMSQSSTPSPSSPITPSECGERTENLWDEEYTGIGTSITYLALNVGDGEFTMSTTASSVSAGAPLFLLSGNVSSGASTATNGVTSQTSRTVSSTGGYITVAYRNVNGSHPEDYDTMLNTGSIPLPYEPYGYKIPILSANTTTPVYLGEVESTRRVKKLVLTGEENWSKPYGASVYRLSLQGYLRDNFIPICTHYLGVLPISNIEELGNDNIAFLLSSSGNNYMYIKSADETTLTSFTQYLTDQYAAGTPVTIWYVLAEPTTGIVNEPLRKIGDYADEVSGISIPVTAGGDTLSVGTTLQPSEVTATYKGWHPVQNVHEAENGQWD